ncbi:MAG: motility associated factor glycosyltransferase family protein [Rhodospirillaceae bacterium]|nr:motility associated factor glycosyltransferase family protein [Rhodospirillales bacterium]
MLDQAACDARREAFKQLFPKMAEKIAAIESPLTTLVVEDGAAIDIDLGTARLYKNDGRQLAREQAEAFVAAPRRIGYEHKDGATGDSLISVQIYNALVDSIRANGIDSFSAAPAGRVGFLFVFGLGLGHHIPILAEKLNVENIVIGEVIDEFVMHAAVAVDWQALAELCEAKGTKLHMVTADNPSTLSTKMSEVLDDCGELFMDGAFYYRHYPSWVLDTAFKNFLDGAPYKMIGRGYYEDERKMVRNAATNLQKFDHYLMQGEFRMRITNTPVFLVASGPSLDNDLAYIKQWRDHAIIVSGGSSLEPLLSEGIIPDYHVELENVVQVYDMCMHMLEAYPNLFPEKRFTGIKLIASVTLNPRVTPLFDEVYFFFRDSVSSTLSFGDDVKIMSAVGPSIANTMVAVAARIGLRDMHFFGMDCGWRTGTNHHSKKTAYYTSKTFRTEKMNGTYSFPGNFGGTIQSDMVFAWCRDMLEEKVRKFSLSAFNCSDGALIKGAVPKLAEALEFTQLVDRERVAEQIRAETTFFKAGEYLTKLDMKRFEVEVDIFAKEIYALCEEALQGDHNFLWMLKELTELHRLSREAEYKHVYPFFYGASINLAKHACFFLNRIDEQEKARAVFQDFVRAYKSLHDEMIDEVRTIYRETREWCEGGAEPWWTDGLPTAPGPGYTW